ncbi:MAG: hypothetical protein AB1324_00340 [Candidatus Micrarchaeota archaeon]
MIKPAVFGALLAAFLAFGCINQPPPPPQECYAPCHVSLDDPGVYDLGCVRGTGPIACTMEYRSGDACLKFIKCDSSCTNPGQARFRQCITCYKACAAEGSGIDVCDDRCAG